jgi:hypothetical protein
MRIASMDDRETDKAHQRKQALTPSAVGGRSHLNHEDDVPKVELMKKEP